MATSEIGRVAAYQRLSVLPAFHPAAMKLLAVSDESKSAISDFEEVFRADLALTADLLLVAPLPRKSPGKFTTTPLVSARLTYLLTSPVFAQKQRAGIEEVVSGHRGTEKGLKGFERFCQIFRQRTDGDSITYACCWNLRLRSIRAEKPTPRKVGDICSSLREIHDERDPRPGVQAPLRNLL